MAAFLEVAVTVARMQFVGSKYSEVGSQTATFYFAVPDRWAKLPDEALQSRVATTVGRIHDDMNRAAHGADPNAVISMVKSARSRVLSPQEASAWPWLPAGTAEAKPTCFVVDGDGSYREVHGLEFESSVPIERDRVRLDRVLPVLLRKQLPACEAVYTQLLETFRDPRPLDERSRFVWGTAVLFFCVLDRLATGGEYADPMRTVDEMIAWLAEGGEVPSDAVEQARQIYRAMFDFHVYRPNDTLFEMVYERAWSVRYSDLDPNVRSAFQGFIHCLTGSRETLARFDFDDASEAAAEAVPTVFAKIDAFNRTVVLPAFEEMGATLERKGKRVTVTEEDRFGDEFLEGFFHEVHPKPRFAGELARSAPDEGEIASGRAKYLGYTLIVEDAEPAGSRYAGKFVETIVFTIGPNGWVSAAPFVVYHMKFDNKLHGFAHRFDNAREFHEIGEIDRYAIQNHFLNAYDYFKIHARGDERPW